MNKSASESINSIADEENWEYFSPFPVFLQDCDGMEQDAGSDRVG